MFISKTQLIRLLTIAVVVISLWTLWKRIDAIIDNYQKYYDIALLNKIWQEDLEKFDKELKSFDKDKDLESDFLVNKDKIWDEYQKSAPFPAKNKPVPAFADEYAKGYYTGLWNFFVTSGFASIFSALFLAGSGFFIIRFIWRKITDDVVERFFSKNF